MKPKTYKLIIDDDTMYKGTKVKQFIKKALAEKDNSQTSQEGSKSSDKSSSLSSLKSVFPSSNPDIKKLLEDLGKYLDNKGWNVLLIEEEGVLKGDDLKNNSFRLSFKFIGKKKNETKNK